MVLILRWQDEILVSIQHVSCCLSVCITFFLDSFTVSWEFACHNGRQILRRLWKSLGKKELSVAIGQQEEFPLVIWGTVHCSLDRFHCSWNIINNQIETMSHNHKRL